MTSLRATRSFCLHSTRAIGLGQHHLLRIAADDARHTAKATGTLTNHTCTMLLPTIQLGGIGAPAAADNRRTTTPFSTNSSVPYGHRRRSTRHARRSASADANTFACISFTGFDDMRPMRPDCAPFRERLVSA
jgi:hypothetical protein